MNFLEKCWDLFQKMRDVDDLKKDVENYDKLQYYIANFWLTNRKDIEDFIVDVRTDNLLYSVIQQVTEMVMFGPLRRLDELPLQDLYNELLGEKYNLILKGAYDSIKLLNEIAPKQDIELQNRFAREDMTIFTQYRCG